MDVVRLTAGPMTRESFGPFGVLIDSRGAVEVDLGDGVPTITGATADRRPFSFDFMARHLRTMQIFSPLVSSRSLIAVAPPSAGPLPDFDKITAFLVDGRLPYSYHRGTWHTPPFPLGEWSSYLVVDRSGTLDNDYELVDLRASFGKTCQFELP